MLIGGVALGLLGNKQKEFVVEHRCGERLSMRLSAEPGQTLQRPRRPAKKSAVVASAAPPDVVSATPPDVASATPVESQDREQTIAEAAYFRAAQRNFESGRELDDWLAAELEIDSLNPAHQESIDDASIIAPIP